MISSDIVAIVLAGGASSRFGSDKLAASLDGRPLLHHALEAVASVADRIVVVIGPEAPMPSVPGAFAARVVVARDAAALGGPLAGLAAGLAAAVTPAGVTSAGVTPAAVTPADATPVDVMPADEAPRVTATGGGPGDRVALVVGGDMPSLVPAVLRRLADTLAADPSLAAMTLAAPGPAPLPMAVRPDAARTAIDAILTSGRRRSLLALLEAVPSAALPAEAWRALDPKGATLRDVDTPTDLEAG